MNLAGKIYRATRWSISNFGVVIRLHRIQLLCRKFLFRLFWAAFLKQSLNCLQVASTKVNKRHRKSINVKKRQGKSIKVKASERLSQRFTSWKDRKFMINKVHSLNAP